MDICVANQDARGIHRALFNTITGVSTRSMFIRMKPQISRGLCKGDA
jgi:hypothetical protein